MLELKNYKRTNILQLDILELEGLILIENAKVIQSQIVGKEWEQKSIRFFPKKL